MAPATPVGKGEGLTVFPNLSVSGASVPSAVEELVEKALMVSVADTASLVSERTVPSSPSARISKEEEAVSPSGSRFGA